MVTRFNVYSLAKREIEGRLQVVGSQSDFSLFAALSKTRYENGISAIRSLDSHRSLTHE